MYSADCKFFAKSYLRNNYWQAVLITAVALLLGGTCMSGVDVSTMINGTTTLYESDSSTVAVNILSIVSLVLGGAVSLGYTHFLFALVYGQATSVSVLFSEFGRLADGFLVKFLTSIYVFLWSLLLVVPGIMKSYSYAMAPYILAENPGMRAGDAITYSKEMMYGHRFRLFCLHLSFIGWIFLSALTMGIGYFFLCPYMETAQFVFYLDLTGRRPIAGSSY